MAKKYNPLTGFLEDTAAKANDAKTYDDAVSEYNKGLRDLESAISHFYFAFETAENEKIKKKSKEMYDKLVKIK